MSSGGVAGDAFEALGDPNRRAIVELLGQGGRSVGELADALPISRPAVSRHLRLLKEAGLVVEEPAGTRRIYSLHDEGVAAVATYLEQVWGEVTVWEPPRRIGYLWHIRRDRDEATDVELTFADAGDGTTRLDIVQSGWERLGDEASTWRESNTGGWQAMIPNFVAAAEADG